MKRLALASVFLLASAALSATDPASFGLDVDIQPAEKPGAYVCHARVTDLATGEDLMVPVITLLAGSPATLTSEGRDFSLTLAVSIEPGGTKTTTELKVSRAGALIASQRSTLAVH